MSELTDTEIMKWFASSANAAAGPFARSEDAEIVALATEALRARKAETNLRLACRLALEWMWYQDFEVDPSWVQEMKEALDGGK